VTTVGVAIAVPDPYGAELQRHRAAFGDPLADAIPTHITLLPPTRLDDVDSMTDLEAHLAKVAADRESFGIHLRGTATFRPVSPVVFVALAEGISDCEQLADGVRSGLLAAGPYFPYHPHVTVAHDLPAAQLDVAFRALADYECRFEVTSFSLYVHGADSVWRPHSDFRLGVPATTSPQR
jgi:2'-5' RNA ligase